MFVKNGKHIHLTTGIVIDDVQIVMPLSAERMAELGITDEPDPVRPDERLFWVSQNPDGSYSTTPRPAEQITAPVWEKIKAERDRRKAGGVQVNGKWYHSDDASRIQQIGLVMMGASIPAGTNWKTMDGSFVEMTPALAGQIFTATAGADAAIFSVAESHKTAMSAAANPFDYNFSTGWPKIFGEE